MLHMIFGSAVYGETLPNFAMYPKKVFLRIMERGWLNDPFSRKLLREIEKKYEIRDDEDVMLGLKKHYNITPIQLSTGVLNLLFCKFANYISRFIMMGANCYPYLFEIADTKDVYMLLEDVLDIDDGMIEEHGIYLENTHQIFYNTREYLSVMLDLDEKGVFCEDYVHPDYKKF